MAGKCIKKDRSERVVDYKEIVQNFIDSKKPALIPKEQKDKNRYNWHNTAEEFGLISHTVKLWTRVGMCGCHNKPIVGSKPFSLDGRLYDSDYECDYEFEFSSYFDEDDLLDFPDSCYLKDYKTNKMRTVVIFSSESKLTKTAPKQEVKDYLLKHGVISIVDGKYSVK